MSHRDDHEHDRYDDLTVLPEGEPPLTPEELRAAKTLARQVDQATTGQAPSEMDELLSAAMMIHAAQHLPALAVDRREQLYQQAVASQEERVHPRRVRQAAPWLALAASLLLLIAAVLLLQRAQPFHHRQGTTSKQVLSRGSDDLLGQPIADRAGASRRLDLVFADRLSGYRAVTLRTGVIP
jgi:hypothetical protein